MLSFLSSLLTIPRLLIAATFFSGCVIIGLFTSSFFRVLPSIGMSGIMLTGVLSYAMHKHHYQRSNAKTYLAFLLVYVVHLASGFITSSANLGDYHQDIILQLPFVVLPISFWLLPPLPSHNLRILWLILILTTAIAALLSTINYLLHSEQINQLYLQSKVMPTEPDHIRFSLIITLSIVSGAVLIIHKSIKGVARKILLSLILLLALYQHMLAVRSGLVTFYALGGIALIWLTFRKHNYLRAGSLLVVLLLLPVISYLCFPTFRNKYANTREDVGRVDHTASANNYSLVGRVYSYKVSLKVIKETPWFGVGKADIEPAMATRYKQEYPNIKPSAYILPHNQFLFSLVGFGIVGMLLFVVGFYHAGISSWPRYTPLLYGHYIIVTLSFMVEYTLETQIGIAFSLFFLLLALEGQKPSDSLGEDEWRPV